jgi:hypothetical protein
MCCVRFLLPFEAKPNVSTLVDRNLIAYIHRTSFVVSGVVLPSTYSSCGQTRIISMVSKTILRFVLADSSLLLFACPRSFGSISADSIYLSVSESDGTSTCEW